MSDYPVAAPDDIAPPIFRVMLIQSMALEYFKAMQPSDFTLDNAMEAALATWETEWDEHPAPRTMEAALNEVRSDLEHWTDQ